MPEFAARVASVRVTPSRADDVSTVIRVVVEAHDITCDPLIQLIDKQVAVRLEVMPLPLTPIEEAIEAAYEEEDPEPVAVPTAGRRRNGTRSSEQS